MPVEMQDVEGFILVCTQQGPSRRSMLGRARSQRHVPGPARSTSVATWCFITTCAERIEHLRSPSSLVSVLRRCWEQACW